MFSGAGCLEGRQGDQEQQQSPQVLVAKKPCSEDLCMTCKKIQKMEMPTDFRKMRRPLQQQNCCH